MLEWFADMLPMYWKKPLETTWDGKSINMNKVQGSKFKVQSLYVVRQVQCSGFFENLRRE